MNDKDQELLVAVLKQGAAKLTKTPETIPVNFCQAAMYAKEADHRDQRSQTRAKKPRKIKKLSKKIFQPKGAP